MAFRFTSVRTGSTCASDMSGTGDRVYFGRKADISVKPDFDDYIEHSNVFRPEAFEGLRGNLYCIDIQGDSGDVESDGYEDSDGYDITGTFVIDRELDLASRILRTIKLSNLVWFIPDGKGKYYVLYSKYRKVIPISEFDSGTEYDDEDNGHTVELSIAPCEFPVSKWVPEDGDLDKWLMTDEDGIWRPELIWANMSVWRS